MKGPSMSTSRGLAMRTPSLWYMTASLSTKHGHSSSSLSLETGFSMADSFLSRSASSSTVATVESDCRRRRRPAMVWFARVRA